MQNLTQSIDNLLAYITLISHAFIPFLIFSSFKKGTALKKLLKNKLVFSFFITLVATLGSLFYSEIAGYTPCKLCWYQRILMYPQVIILGIAVLKNKTSALKTTLPLSLVGAPLALYHYILQLKPSMPSACSSIGYSISCSQTFTMSLGYITIPLMSFTAFLLLVLLTTLP